MKIGTMSDLLFYLPFRDESDLQTSASVDSPLIALDDIKILSFIETESNSTLSLQCLEVGGWGCLIVKNNSFISDIGFT
jgi:hypothetical protein